MSARALEKLAQSLLLHPFPVGHRTLCREEVCEVCAVFLIPEGFSRAQLVGDTGIESQTET